MSTILTLLALVPCLPTPQAGPPTSQGSQVGVSAPAATLEVHPGSVPGGGYLSNLYSIDDGTTDSSLGLILGGTLCWLQTFDTRPLAEYDVITEIDAAYGFPQNPGFCVPIGTPVTACLWEDPNDDGDPSDAVLLRTAASTVQNPDTQFLNPIPIQATTVRGRFFVGVFLFHAQSRFPASRDLGTPSQGRAFFLGTLLGVSVFDPSNLTSPGHTQIFSMDNVQGVQTSVWRLQAVGSGPAVVSYCSAKTNSLGCVPLISATGAPQSSAFSGFVVRGSNVRNNKNGLLFYGVNGRLNFPFQGGTLCIKSPLKRTPSRASGGSPPPANNCSGVYELDMTAFARGFYGGTPLPELTQVGALIDCQWWGRDPGFPAPNNVTLSGGLEYVVLP